MSHWENEPDPRTKPSDFAKAILGKMITDEDDKRLTNLANEILAVVHKHGFTTFIPEGESGIVQLVHERDTENVKAGEYAIVAPVPYSGTLLIKLGHKFRHTKLTEDE